VAPRKSTKKPEPTFTFRVKRSHFYALFVPLAFLLGLTVGFLAWGQGPASTPAAANPSGGAESSSAEDIASQLADLPRYDVEISAADPSLGEANAPITIIEFADFECPFCQRHAQQTHGRLLEAYGDQIRFVYKDFPLSSLHPNAYSAAIAGQCANEQGLFWEYHDLLFSGRLGLGREAYEMYAQEAGLDGAEFTDCLDEDRYAEAVQADYNQAVQLGISSTPTFFVNGIAVVGAQDYSLFAQIIDYELNQQN
jgi:protein-disulfide isomerase